MTLIRFNLSFNFSLSLHEVRQIQAKFKLYKVSLSLILSTKDCKRFFLIFGNQHDLFIPSNRLDKIYQQLYFF